MWTRVIGQPAFNADLFNRCLKLDGVNDYLNLPSNIFYQVGTSEFSFVIKFQHISDYDKGKALLRTSNNINLPRFVVNIEQDGTIKMRFISQKHIDVGQSNVGDLISYSSASIPIFQWNTMVIIRRGTNYAPSTDTVNYANSIRNPDNIELWVNGVKLNRLAVSMLETDGLQYLMDSNDNFTLCGLTTTATSFFNGYLDFFAYYNKALSTQEIFETSQGRFTDDLAKGIWNFTGNTNDDSSVGNAMTLLNSATEEYITFPKTSGIFVFKSGTTNQQFTRIFPANITITAVYKSQPYTYQYSLDGTTWQKLTSVGGSNTEVNITVPAGTPFYIKDPNGRASVCVIHLTY